MMTRRKLIQMGLTAAASAPFTAAHAVSAPELERAGDAWLLRSPAGGDHLRLSALAPVFDFDGFALGGVAAGPGEWSPGEGGAWTGRWRVTAPRPAVIRTTLAREAASGVLTRTASIVLEDGPTVLLRTVTLDVVDTPGQAPAARPGLQSYPVLCRSFFMGVRFPMAFADAEGERVRLGHRPGVRVRPGTAWSSRMAVYGACPAGGARTAFEAYVAGLRPTPRGVHFDYNSWWTSPVPYTEADILGLIAAFRKSLFEPYGVSPDSFCIDMGWAKNTTLWQIDPKLFPAGFTKISEACAAIRSNIGIWISPSGVYGQALDLAWAKSAGYEADAKACLGGPHYQQAFRAALLDHTAHYGVRQVKFDGYVPTCDAPDHGHEAGALSAEAIAVGMIDVFTALRRAAPDLWMEPTCFGYDPSPWWLEYVNSVIGTFGDDAPNGRVPAPVYRQSYTSGRDFYNLKGAVDILAPIAAQEVLGIIHQTAEPLQDDAVMTVLRGHQFLPLYINPAFMTSRRWEFTAALMQWTRRNAAVLAWTRPILPAGWAGSLEASMPRAPYGYGHWRDGRGLAGLRNPWIEPATLAITPTRDLGAPSDAGLVSVSAVYPERRVLASSMGADQTLEVALGPYETRVLEVGPPVPAARVRPAEAPPAARPALEMRACWFEADEPGPRFGPDYTRLMPADGRCVRLRITGDVEAPRTDRHDLLILIEGSAPVEEPLCRLTVGGHDLPAEVISSEAGWRATGSPATEHWLWLIAPLPPGASRVDADLLMAGAGQRVWGWTAGRRRIPWRRAGHVDGSTLPPPEERWLSAVRAFGPAQPGGDMTVERGPAPVQRIEGVFLDTLEPLETSQGWGKLERNRSVWEKPMTIGGRRFVRGLGTHAPARQLYALDGRYRRFQAWAGPDEATGPTITMEVCVDGRSMWKSGILSRGAAPHRLDLNVTGAKRLELIVGDGGNGLAGDHADWADAMLLR